MDKNSLQEIVPDQHELGNQTATNPPSGGTAVRQHTAVRGLDAPMREDPSGAETVLWQTSGWNCPLARGIGNAEPSRMRMSFGPELILILLAIAAIGWGGLWPARAADGELIAPKGIPKTGSFYRMQRQTPPLPFNPFPDLPVYAVDWQRRIFLVDDRLVDYERLDAERKAQVQAEGEGEPEDGPAYDGYGTNLWIEIYGYDLTHQLAFLTLHNTRSDYYYQLLSKTELSPPWWWNFGQVILNSTGTNQLYFDPVPALGWPIQFYRGVEGFPVVSVSVSWTNPCIVLAAEPVSDTNNPMVGIFYISRNDGFDENLTVFYRLGGTAVNGVDYTNLSGTVTIAANDSSAQVQVHPLFDTDLEFDETVTLTLVLTNGYVVNPGSASATMWIEDYLGTNEIFRVVADLAAYGLQTPTGLDYHAPSNLLIASANYQLANRDNFIQIGLAGTNTFITNWSGIQNLFDEIKLATVRTTANGFSSGEMFFGTGTNGHIGWLAADETVSNLAWAVVTTNSAGTNFLFRGSFHVDQSGMFGGDLIAVTGGTSEQGGEVWRVTASGTATLLADITSSSFPHLEGVIVLTNDVQKWGPWAGKILTGAESKIPPLIHAIDANGLVTSFVLGIEAEDFDIIPPNQDLYCTAFVDHKVLKVSRNLLTNYVGDLLITQEGLPPNQCSRLFIVKWNPTNAALEMRSFALPTTIFQVGFEHVTFAPIDLPAVPNP